jgi:hypothetical protein
MKWLTVFFLAAFVLGDLMVLPIALWWDSAHGGAGEMLSGSLLLDLLYIVPVVIVAAPLRLISGRLSGFAAGVIGMVCCQIALAALMGGGTRLSVPAFFWHGGTLFGAIALARIHVFRDRALSLSPPTGVEGLEGTFAFVMADGESAASALGKRSNAERRWATFGRRRTGHDDTAAILAKAPRRLPRRLASAFALESQWAWWAIAAGVLAAPAWVYLSVRFWRERFYDVELLPLLVPPLVGLALLRFGVLRLLECVRLARLLRDGEVVFGTPDPLMIPGGSRNILVVAPFGDERVVVQMPAPLDPSAQQTFLVDRVRRRIVAWDLLPFIPTVASDGSLSAPSPQALVPRLVGPLAALVATIVAAILVLGRVR